MNRKTIKALNVYIYCSGALEHYEFACTAIMQTQRNLRATETRNRQRLPKPSLAPTQLPVLRQARLHFRSVDVKWCTRFPHAPPPTSCSPPTPFSITPLAILLYWHQSFQSGSGMLKKVNMYYMGNKVCIV